MTSLETLTIACAPPPASSVPVIDWRAVEENIRRDLPSDYKELASRYGPGTFGGFVWIYHPTATAQWVDLTGPAPAAIRAQLERDQESNTFHPPHDPHQLFPMGVTDNGNYLFWVTDPEDRPDAWRVAVNEARGPKWYTHHGNLTDFLAGVLSGQLTVPFLPYGLLDGDVAFTPSLPHQDSGGTPQVQTPSVEPPPRGHQRCAVLGPGQRLRRTRPWSRPRRDRRQMERGLPITSGHSTG